MLEISNTEVFGLHRALLDCSLPKKTGKPEYVLEAYDDIKVPKKLGSVDVGTGHDCFLKGITVQFHLKYSLYFTKQLQRYHFIDFISSQSTMHCITKMDIEESCNTYVDRIIIDNLKFWVQQYNDFDYNLNIANTYNPELFPDMQKEKKEVDYIYINHNGWIAMYTKYDIFMKIISNTPAGFEYWAAMTTNYLQLKTIYFQRKNHKLKEDWGYFCNWIEQLPMFKKLVLEE